MTNHLAARLLLLGVIAAGAELPIRAQSGKSNLLLEAFFVDSINVNSPTRLWMKITNTGQGARIMCRQSWGYSWVSDDPRQPSPGEAFGNTHGCGDDEHDPFWLLLPGQSRFDSYGLAASGGQAAALEVHVEVTHRAIGANGSGENETLSWQGRVADALAFGVKLRGR